MKILHFCWTTFGNKITYWKKLPSRLRVNDLTTIKQVSNHYLSQWWSCLLIHLYILSPQCVNTLRLRQNGRHFPDDIFKCIFLNENEWISINISLKFVPKYQINNIPSLFQIMAWCRPGDKPLSEAMMVSLLTPQWVNYFVQNHNLSSANNIGNVCVMVLYKAFFINNNNASWKLWNVYDILNIWFIKHHWLYASYSTVPL